MILLLLKLLLFDVYLASGWKQYTQVGLGDRKIYTLENARFINDLGDEVASPINQEASVAIDGNYDPSSNVAIVLDVEPHFIVDIKEAIDNNQDVYIKEIRLFANPIYMSRSDMSVHLRQKNGGAFECHAQFIIDLRISTGGVFQLHVVSV